MSEDWFVFDLYLWISALVKTVNGGCSQMSETVNWEKEIIYPRRDDTLFQRANSQSEKILFADWLAGDWLMYPDGYKMAADMVVDTLSGYPWEDRLILPIIFMYRHYVELRIKHIILELDRLSGTRIDTERFRKHNLQSLWHYVLAHLDCIRSKANKEIMSATERLINELNTLDPDSMHFRYATDKERLNAMPLPHSLSMTGFKDGMEKVKSGLDYVAAGIDLETEGRTVDADMQAEMRSYMDF